MSRAPFRPGLCLSRCSAGLLVNHHHRGCVGYRLTRQNIAVGELVVFEHVIVAHGGLALGEPGHARPAVAGLTTEWRDGPGCRALSNSVSPGTCGTDTFLRSRWIVTVPPASPSSAATSDAGDLTGGDASKSSTRTRAASGSAERTTAMKPSGPHR